MATRQFAQAASPRRPVFMQSDTKKTSENGLKVRCLPARWTHHEGRQLETKRKSQHELPDNAAGGHAAASSWTILSPEGVALIPMEASARVGDEKSEADTENYQMELGSIAEFLLRLGCMSTRSSKIIDVFCNDRLAAVCWQHYRQLGASAIHV